MAIGGYNNLQPVDGRSGWYTGELNGNIYYLHDLGDGTHQAYANPPTDWGSNAGGGSSGGGSGGGSSGGLNIARAQFYDVPFHVPFNQTYDGQRAPYDRLDSQIADAMGASHRAAQWVSDNHNAFPRYGHTTPWMSQEMVTAAQPGLLRGAGGGGGYPQTFPANGTAPAGGGLLGSVGSPRGQPQTPPVQTPPHAGGSPVLGIAPQVQSGLVGGGQPKSAPAPAFSYPNSQATAPTTPGGYTRNPDGSISMQDPNNPWNPNPIRIDAATAAAMPASYWDQMTQGSGAKLNQAQGMNTQDLVSFLSKPGNAYLMLNPTVQGLLGGANWRGTFNNTSINTPAK